MKGVVISRENSKMATGKWITSAVVAIGPKTEADAAELYEKLCVGHTVSISLPAEVKQLFGGMLADEYGNSLYIKEVIYNDPATIVFWSDGTKTTSKCQKGDIYSPEVGLILAVLKKITSGDFVATLLEDWVPEGKTRVTLKDVRKKHRND